MVSPCRGLADSQPRQLLHCCALRMLCCTTKVNKPDVRVPTLDTNWKSFYVRYPPAHRKLISVASKPLRINRYVLLYSTRLKEWLCHFSSSFPENIDEEGLHVLLDRSKRMEGILLSSVHLGRQCKYDAGGQVLNGLITVESPLPELRWELEESCEFTGPSTVARSLVLITVTLAGNCGKRPSPCLCLQCRWCYWD